MLNHRLATEIVEKIWQRSANVALLTKKGWDDDEVNSEFAFQVQEIEDILDERLSS